MSDSAHLWAIECDDQESAERLRNEITALADPVQNLLLLDLAILVRNTDGSYTLDRQPFPACGNILDRGPLAFLVGIALAVPLLSNEAVGALLGLAGTNISSAVGIDDKFIKEVGAMMRPGASAVLVLDSVGDLEAVLRALKGMGGKILKTNVDVERVKLLQATLSAHSDKLIDASKRSH
jgi:uncharacterized membrane protein